MAPDKALDLLRRASQRKNVKVSALPQHHIHALAGGRGMMNKIPTALNHARADLMVGKVDGQG